MTSNYEYQLSREIRMLIDDMMDLKSKDLPEFCLLRDELKRDLGKGFYNKYLKESLGE